MPKIVRRLAVCMFVAVCSSFASAGMASASVSIPFQIDPAPFGNPNGSFDAPAVRCVAVVGDQPGTVTITGGKEGGWGCLLSSDVHWVNLSTGASGFVRTSDGLYGRPAEASVSCGPGQVVVTVVSATGTITPGVASILVP